MMLCSLCVQESGGESASDDDNVTSNTSVGHHKDSETDLQDTGGGERGGFGGIIVGSVEVCSFGTHMRVESRVCLKYLEH